MKLHGNARLSPKGRLLLCRRVLDAADLDQGVFGDFRVADLAGRAERGKHRCVSFSPSWASVSVDTAAFGGAFRLGGCVCAQVCDGAIEGCS